MLNAQDLTCLSANDLRVVRQIIADREFYKASFEESERQRVATIGSRDKWKELYESEKKRADEIQGGRIDESKAEADDLRKALDKAKEQMADDRQKIGEQNAEIISLRSSRKWYAGFGFAAGAAAGYYIGKNQDRIVQAASGFTGQRFTPPPSRYNFGARFNF
jgi:hypothetical protein